MNKSTSEMQSHRYGFDIGSRYYFFKKRSEFSVSLHGANTEHKKKFS